MTNKKIFTSKSKLLCAFFTLLAFAIVASVIGLATGGQAMQAFASSQESQATSEMRFYVESGDNFFATSSREEFLTSIL